MTGLRAMLRKELLEQVRTYRLPVVLALYFLIGTTSPLLARFTPQLLALVAGSDQMGGLQLVVTKPPDVHDALFQLQKNFSMLPLVVILLGMGALSSERRRGTAALVLTKPVSRGAWLASKFVAAALLYLTGTILAGGVGLLYTQVLLGPVELRIYLQLCGALLLVQWVYLALVLLASALLDSSVAAAGACIAALAMFSASSLLGRVGHFTPGGLSTAAVDLALGRPPTSLFPAVVASALIVVVALGLAQRVVRRQEL